ncbi:MAG TPA: PRC-barrel domain-containing protein [Thermoanaerobaculia bacterium]|nr:PRC-barrel domain-containing protein [Thermoanaerobaculia bacterium]
MQRDDVPAARTGAATLDPAASPAAPQIAPLTHLKDYKVAKEDPDVRGWPLIARDGRTVGKVHDLLVDTAALRVRYLDVELERDLVASAPVVPGTAAPPPVVDRGDGKAAGHHVLAPIGFARLDEDHKRVYLDGMDAHDAAVLPAYDHQAFNRDYETGVRRRWDPRWSPAPNQDFYAGDAYDESRFYGPRRRR